MRVAITGGTGFVGSHVAESLVALGHEVVVIARGVDVGQRAQAIEALETVVRVSASVTDMEALEGAFADCDVVVHCAGINREIGDQTYKHVHVDGTMAVIDAAEKSGVKRLVFVSFLRARPGTSSRYHQSKWQAEELVRGSKLEWTIVKTGITYGRGDHMLDHLSHTFFTVPVFAMIGNRYVRPVSVSDVAKVLVAAAQGDLPFKCVAVVGPTELRFDDAARMVARATGRRVLFVRTPLIFHELLARVAELSMITPLVSRAQVFMLREGIIDPTGDVDVLPNDLRPSTPFSDDSIRSALPAPGRFRWGDFRSPFEMLLSTFIDVGRRRLSRQLSDSERAEFTYSEVGQTADDLPNNYKHDRVSVQIGEGRAAFKALSDYIDSWGLQRSLGFRVHPNDSTVATGATIVMTIGFGLLRLTVPVRVVYTVNDDDRHGFAYGTLPSHPESGEEYFGAWIRDDDSVLFELTAFSQPASFVARLARPIARLGQRLALRGYVRSARQAIASSTSQSGPGA